VAQSAVNYSASGFGNVLTVTFWIKSNMTGTANILSLGGGQGSIAITPTNKLQVSFPGNTGIITGTAPTAGTPTINNNAWHFVAVVMDNSQTNNTTTGASASDTIRVYYDSAVQQTVTYTPTPTRSGAHTFTTSVPNVGSTIFAGSIDDVRIYGQAAGGTGTVNGALTTTQISAIYGAGAQ
jgi:hypothetical protein